VAFHRPAPEPIASKTNFKYQWEHENEKVKSTATSRCHYSGM
jgi:hypothetical protein